jgi:REase_DpnII-MboI
MVRLFQDLGGCLKQMRLFDREFRHLSPDFLQDLDTLEREGSIYTQLWQEDAQEFRFCRIRFRPGEIIAYVDAVMAYDEFLGYCEDTGDPIAALDQISDAKIRNRVLEYNRWTESVGQHDTRYCFAAFMGEHLEDLICGGQLERYEFLAHSYTGDRRFLLTEILEMFPSSAGYLGSRTSKRPSYRLEEEQDLRDLLYVIIKSIFPDARLEEYTRAHAGSAKRIDIVVPGISTVIEVKCVRDARHAKKVADELRIDFESYYVHPDCSKLVAYVWDSNHLLLDRSNFINDLRGLQVKGGSKFSVEVMVKP